MKKKISVIMPVYNAEKYLNVSLTSLQNQTYKNLEIIAVDDASTDASAKIIQSYSNVIYLSCSSNQGAAHARNLALDYVSGEFVGFLDADDVIDVDYFEKLYQSIEHYKSDIAICDIQTVYDGASYRNERVRFGTKNGIVSVRQLLSNGLIASPTNKLFRTSIIKKYPFVEGIINEDIPTVIPSLLDARKISYTAETVYQYFQHSTSVQNSEISMKKFDIFRAVSICFHRMPNPKQRDIQEMIVFSQLLNFLNYKILEIDQFQQRRKYLKLYMNQLKKYDWYHNSYQIEMFSKMGTFHRLYYKVLYSLLRCHFCTLTSFVISCKKWYQRLQNQSVIPQNITMDDVIRMVQKNAGYQPSEFRVSVVIPNYNYEKFLLQRLYSIFSQKVRIHELIFLDDCSTDQSIPLFEMFQSKVSDIVAIKTLYNTENSGNVFKQWQKGYEFASGDFVWITEADDYCSNQFLTTVMKPFKQDLSVCLSYCNTSFINESGEIVYKNILPSIDLQHTGHWNRNYINDGKDEINSYCYLNCTISNVSSVVMKKGIPSKVFVNAQKYHQIGDWMFYIGVLSDGKIAFSKKIANYYRIHGSNVTSMTKKQNHYHEIMQWYRYYKQHSKPNSKQIHHMMERKKELEQVWGVKEERI
ncbi:MAG: glycosyltransferase family 2 protein [Candidatus Faecenecus gallistercoris]|nr:glycosyltransferase family 2 protein [Bacillota bacterium]MDY4050662.1 glycosyltransferase family 2 protein [Candidatus Faecenecus gallistercoris]